MEVSLWGLEFFIPLSKFMPCKGIEVKTDKENASKGVGKLYSFLGKSCGFSLQMYWSIDWCTQGKTKLLRKCSSSTAPPAEPSPLELALSSQLDSYWFKCFTIDCIIKAWVGEGTCSQLWYPALLYMTQSHIIYLCVAVGWDWNVSLDIILALGK